MTKAMTKMHLLWFVQGHLQQAPDWVQPPVPVQVRARRPRQGPLLGHQLRCLQVPAPPLPLLLSPPVGRQQDGLIVAVSIHCLVPVAYRYSISLKS